MKKKLLALALLGAGSMFAQVSLGIRIGPPPQPRIVRVRPNQPGAGWVWVDGYSYPQGNRYRWHDGYWTRPPYDGANWIGPRYQEGMFYNGYWGGSRAERFEHDHRWDRERGDRDYNRYDKHDDKHDDKHGDKDRRDRH